MNKAILVIAILGLLVVAGCSPAAPVPQKEAPTTVVKTDPAVAQATQGLVGDKDNVEIGEMI